MKKTVRFEQNLLFAAQLVAHFAVVPMFFYASFQDYIQSVVVYSLFFCVGISMTYHRLVSHKSWSPPKGFEYIGSCLGALCLQGSPLAWAAMHREHHRFADSTKDPHAPKGNVFNAHFLSMYHEPKLRYILDYKSSHFQHWLHRNYWALNITYALTVCLLFGPFAVISLFLFPAVLSWHAASLVNTLCHMFGYRNFVTRDRSTNVWWVALFNFGEGWHNNHHANPQNPYFGRNLWEIDPSGLFIRLLNQQKSGVAKNQLS